MHRCTLWETLIQTLSSTDLTNIKFSLNIYWNFYGRTHTFSFFTKSFFWVHITYRWGLLLVNYNSNILSFFRHQQS